MLFCCKMDYLKHYSIVGKYRDFDMDHTQCCGQTSLPWPSGTAILCLGKSTGDLKFKKR